MKRRSLSVFLLVLCMLLVSCSARGDIDCSTVMSKLLGESLEKNGSVFLLGADEGSLEYFSDEIKLLMYGENSLDRYFPKIEDCAVYVSSHIPEEIAVFKCYSRSDTDEIAKMCLERADMIKVSLRGGAWKSKTEKIRVTIHRQYVVFSFTDDPQEIERKIKNMV